MRRRGATVFGQLQEAVPDNGEGAEAGMLRGILGGEVHHKAGDGGLQAVPQRALLEHATAEGRLQAVLRKV